MWGRARNRGLGARGWGQGGSRGGLKLFTSDCSTHIAVGRMWGWGNDGGGDGGGEGGGERLLLKF